MFARRLLGAVATLLIVSVGLATAGEIHDAVAAGDTDRVAKLLTADPDLVAGNYNHADHLYLNNGAADPWNGVSGSDVAIGVTQRHGAGDADGDGDLDLVAGNSLQVNRLYLNNGTSDPWNGVSGVDITADAHATYSVAMGDVDGDGDLDLVVGNS